MARLICVTLLLILNLAPLLQAADYLVRLEISGYKDAPEAGTSPEEIISRSLELICQPQVPARCKVQSDRETLTLNIVLHPAKENSYVAEFKFSQSVDTGDTEPDGKGGRQKRVERTQMASLAAIPVGQIVDIGVVESTRKDEQGKVTKSKQVVRLSIQNFVPQIDTD